MKEIREEEMEGNESDGRLGKQERKGSRMSIEEWKGMKG